MIYHTCIANYVCLFLCGQRNFESVAENNLSTLGLGLDLESRCQEAEKVRHHLSLLGPGVFPVYMT